MLVLSHKVGQRIVLGPEIQITVVRIRNQRVKLGITAPRDVPIKRETSTRRGQFIGKQELVAPINGAIASASPPNTPVTRGMIGARAHE